MSSFTLDLQNFAKKAAANADELVGTVVTQIVAEVDLRSPVDTGRFRGNWQLGVGGAPSGITQRLDPAGTSTKARNFAVIPEKASGNLYVLANNLPYAMRLEMGWSKQAPAGMVGVTVEKFQAIVTEAAGRLQ